MRYFFVLQLMFIILLSPYCVKSQVDNMGLINIKELSPSDSNKLVLNLDGLAFTKNNEYFNKIADGLTLFGYQFAPTVSYQPVKNFSIEAGVFLRKDFGDDGIQEVEPLFRFIYERDNLQMIFGNLNGDLNHRLIEPLYDFEKFLIDPIENGIQVRYFSKTFWVDGWVDWQKMIHRGAPFQEEVAGGLSFEKEFFQEADYSLFMPIQALAYHKGGQIDISPEPITTFFNSAVGMRLLKKSEGFVKEWEASAYYTYYKDFSFQKRAVFNDGEGIMLNASFTTSFDLQTMLSYWKGDEFISIMGGQLYPSISSRFKTPYHVEEIRELLIMRFTHTVHVYNNIYLVSRFEPHYDLQNELFEFSHGLYISYYQPINLLKRVRK